MNNNDPININKLFDEIIEEQVVVEEQSKIHIKEQERLQNLYNLNPNNIDDVFDSLIEFNKNYIESNIGKIFGERTVLKFSHKDVRKRSFFQVQCSCGKIDIVNISLLKFYTGKYTKCRKCSIISREIKKREQLIIKRKENPVVKIGDIFGHREVIDVLEKGDQKTNYIVVKCRCKCGEIKDVLYPDLKKGKSQSCQLCKTAATPPPAIGTKNGDRTVIENGRHLWIKGKSAIKVRCICGYEQITLIRLFLKYNHCKSCSAKKRCQNIKIKKLESQEKDKLYESLSQAPST